MNKKLFKRLGKTVITAWLILTIAAATGLSPVYAFQRECDEGANTVGAYMGGAYREGSLEHGTLQAGFSLPKIRLPHIELPEMDLSGFNGGSEKEKLREALKTMDDLGISPGKLVRRAWEFLSRKETKEKLEKAAEDAGKAFSAGKESLQKAADRAAKER